MEVSVHRPYLHLTDSELLDEYRKELRTMLRETGLTEAEIEAEIEVQVQQLTGSQESEMSRRMCRPVEGSASLPK